jgi:Polysaccharide pyruvyl transferase
VPNPDAATIAASADRDPRVLVTGWFSFDEVVATIGDELVADEICRWLADSELAYDVAWAPYLRRGADWRSVDPDDYSHLIFASGPLSDHPLLRGLTDRFGRSRRVAVNVSVVDNAGRELFHEVLERDGRVDPAIAAAVAPRPVVGVAYAPEQDEYAGRSQATRVRNVIDRWLAERMLPSFEIQMDLFDGRHPRIPAQAISLIRKADVVVSMRLHALVLAVAAGVPVIACDPIVGGAKVTAQALSLDWPLLLPAQSVAAVTLDAALADARADWISAALHRSRRAGLGAQPALRARMLAHVGAGDPEAAPGRPEQAARHAVSSCRS